MTEQERIICEIITKSKEIATIPEIAHCIVRAFPQITKKPVEVELYSGFVDNSISIPCVALEYNSINFQATGEPGRQAWIDSHFVEVINE
jgi:hypothetical protein